MADLKLNAEPRTIQKNSVRKLKKQNRVPAVVYGAKIDNLYFSLKSRDAQKYSASVFDNKIFTLESPKKEINGLKVLKKEVVFHRVTRDPMHFDFLALDMSRKIRVHVEVKFIGKAKGVKEEGGVFNTLRRNIEVECLASKIPDHLELDISHLGLNDTCHVSDLVIPKEIKLVTRKESTLCLVSKAQEEEEKPAAADPEAPEGEAAAAADAEKEPAKEGAEGADKPAADAEKKPAPAKK